MSDSNSSVVSIVAIIAILLLVGFAIYFFMMRSSNDATLEIEINEPEPEPMSEVAPGPENPMPGALAFVSFPG